MKREQRLFLDREQQARAERNRGLAAKLDLVAQRHVAGHELAHLVELAVVGQIGLGHHAEDASAMDEGGAVEKLMVDYDREADDRDGSERAARLDNPAQRREAAVEHDALLMQVLAGIAGQSEFREEYDCGMAFGRLAHQGDGLAAVEGRVGDAHGRDGDRDPDHVVVMEIEKVLARSQCLLLGPAFRLDLVYIGRLVKRIRPRLSFGGMLVH